jgi:syntaxin 7
MQENVRLANEHLDRCQRMSFSKRLGDSLEQSLDRSQTLAQEAEQLFRDWTVHLAGEPTARHKKKFSYDKLQKAFRDEVDRLKDVSRRAIAIRQASLKAEGRPSLATSIECLAMCEGQGSSDEEHCLLAPSASSEVATIDEDVALQNRISVEREEGIKRIQSQVKDVNQMFRDLASIVSDQGQQLETIEHQAESASSNTAQAVKELKKTSKRQRGQFERLCCMLLVAMLVLCFFIMQAMPHLQQSASSSASSPKFIVSSMPLLHGD